MKAWFECDECEDQENVDTEKEGWPCECGGSMYLVKPDHYSEVEYIENCMICRNRGSAKCTTCKWD